MHAPLRRRGPGRPRNSDAHAAILRATAQLLGEGGYAGLTIEGVAVRAGVGRQTIYRRWASKLALVTELLAEVSESAPLPDTGSIRGDVAQLYRRYATTIPTAGGPIIPALIAESLYNAELAPLVRQYIMTRRQAAIEIFERARKRGEIRADADPAMIVDLMSGFSWYRKLIAGIPMPETDDRAMVALLLDGITARPDAAPGARRRRSPRRS